MGAVVVGGDASINGVDFAEGVLEDGSVGVLLEGEDEVKVVADVALTRADKDPAVAQKTDPLGWGEGGFGFGYDGVELRWGVGRAVIAFAVGVGIEERHRRVRRDGKGCVFGREDTAEWLGGGLDADREGPLLFDAGVRGSG